MIPLLIAVTENIHVCVSGYLLSKPSTVEVPQSGCGGAQYRTQAPGVITSMGYGSLGEYDANANCSWLIVAGSDQVLLTISLAALH